MSAVANRSAAKTPERTFGLFFGGVLNSRFRALLECFKEITGCPILVKTSFNVRVEPLVNTPEGAYRCFAGADLDALAVETVF